MRKISRVFVEKTDQRDTSGELGFRKVILYQNYFNLCKSFVNCCDCCDRCQLSNISNWVILARLGSFVVRIGPLFEASIFSWFWSVKGALLWYTPHSFFQNRKFVLIYFKKKYLKARVLWFRTILSCEKKKFYIFGPKKYLCCIQVSFSALHMFSQPSFTHLAWKSSTSFCVEHFF
jgi:hypothetical protein